MKPGNLKIFIFSLVLLVFNTSPTFSEDKIESVPLNKFRKFITNI